MNVLVLCTDYAGEYFVQTRNLYYETQQIKVTIIDNQAKADYEKKEGKVYTMKSYRDKLSKEKFDLLICHAPTLRTHYVFLRKYQKNFSKIVFVFHGHEVLNIQKVYSEPYYYMRKKWYQRVCQTLYDKFKLKLWRFYFPNVVHKSHFVFVSQWMLNEFLKWTKIPLNTIEGSYSVIYNSVGTVFETSKFESSSEKKYDFIAIRSSLDSSKYAADIINNLAKNNPQYKFLLVGKGTFFEHYEKAANIEWRNEVVSHEVMARLLNCSRCALMPTRTDAQGVSACEMATFGIPLITSDIPVCREVFESFGNVAFIKNEEDRIDLKIILEDLEKDLPYVRNEKYFSKNTVQQEVKLFYSMVNSL